MPFKLLSILLLATLSSALAAPQVKVVDAFVEATPPGAEVGGAYLTLVNSGDRPIKLLGGSTPVAERVTPMKNVTVKGGMPGMKGMASMSMTGMRDVKFMTVPARGKLVLGPGGAMTLKLPVKRL